MLDLKSPAAPPPSLAPAFAAEREMLEAGGKARIGASKGGQLAAKARSEARGRLADGKGRKGKR